MNDKQDLKLQRYLPYGCVLAAVPICYAPPLIVLGQHAMAAGGAALGAAIAFVACRLVQRRGQFSVAVTGIVLPLLVAGACSLMLHLKPFAERHRSISAFRAAGITINARQADQSGEWLRDASGNILPYWLVNAIGSESLSNVSSIEGELSVFQAGPYRSIEPSYIRTMTLRRSSEDAPLSPELTKWLTTCPKLNRLFLDFDGFTPQERQALSILSDECRIFLTIRNCEQHLDLVFPEHCKLVQLEGAMLPLSTAQGVSQIENLGALMLDIRQFDAESILALSAIPKEHSPFVKLQGGLDGSSLLAAAKLGTWCLEVHGIAQVPALPEVSLADIPQTKCLRIIDSTLTVPECVSLARLFQCEQLNLHLHVPLDRLGRDQSEPIKPGDEIPSPYLSFSPDDMNAFWTLPNLRHIQLYDGQWNDIERR